MAVPEPASAASLTVRLFGPSDLRRNGQPLSRLRTRYGHWLLALLVLRHGQEVERSWLAGTLWPESAAPLAYRSLRSCLADLRRCLGEDAHRLQSPTPRTLCLDLTAVEIDVLAFDAALARGDPASLERAVVLYRGPLLEGCTEAWAFQERQAREQGYLAARERLAALAFERGDTGAAEQHLRSAVGTDPLRESTQRALMQVLAASGNYAAALLCYRELRLHLYRELNTEPDAETQTLFDQLRREARRLAAKGSGMRDESRRGQGVLIPHPSSLVPAPPSPPLPVQLMSFVGREPQMAEVKQLLAATHLLTLTGAGGCGKTRLALQVAADLLEEYPEGVWLVELASLADPALVSQTVASALGVREEPGRPLTATLTDYLRPKSLLLILDNCEHLLAACAQLAGTLLRSCPQLRILASSREGLGISGEQTYRVPSLSLPGIQVSRHSGIQDPQGQRRASSMSDHEHLNTRTPEYLLQFEAVQLFVDRARLSQATFALTPANASLVAQVCQRLDGIPLAIELAAARVRALPVEQIHARLDDMFRLLTGGSRTALPRQQTLRALIDWSFDLLSEAEQMLLSRLSVFAGGWTLAAAEAVCGDARDEGRRMRDEEDGEGPPSLIPHPSPLVPEAVLDLLTSLVDKSLVAYDDGGGYPRSGGWRYHLLETVRQYARDRLLEAGGSEVVVRERHSDWFLTLAEQAAPELEGADQQEWLERLEVEHDNLRAALAWSGAQGEGEAGLRLGGALWRFWEMRGYVGEGRERLAGLLALPGSAARTAARAAVLDGAGVLAQNQGDHGAARALFEESLAISRELGNTRGIARSLQSLGWGARERGDYGTARPLIQESLALFRELGYKRGITWSLYNLGLVARDQGDHGALRTLFEERLAICRELGDQRGIAESLVGLAQVAQAWGESEKARTLLDEAHAVGQGTEACMEQGHVLLELGDYPTARSRYEEGLALRRGRRAGDRWIACALLEAGHAAWLQGEPVIARSRALEALAMFQELSDNEGVLAALESLGAAALAPGPCTRAACGERAARLWGATAALRAALGAPGASWWRRPQKRIGEAARAVSLDPELAAAWAEGRTMSLDEAVAFALQQTGPS